MSEVVDGAAHALDVSVVIPTYNRAPMLDRCLERLASQTVPLDRFEVIVADDASTDDTEGVVERWSARGLDVHYVRCPKVFAGGARNRGVEHARADRLLFLGDDILATPDLLERHAVAAAQWGDDVVLVGEVRYDEATAMQPFMRFLEEEGVHHDFPRLRAAADEPVGGRYFYACNASLSTARFRDSGGFDERLQRAWEDSELGLRLEDRGAVFRFLPGSTGTHVHPLTLPGYLGFLRRGRPDMVAALRRYRESGGEVAEPPRKPVLDRLTPDWLVASIARMVSWAERVLPDRVRRTLYRKVLRFERRRVLQLVSDRS